jgi:hypothetical protein
MALDIVTGHGEKSYGVVPSSMLALATAQQCAGWGNVTQKFMACGLARRSGRFFQLSEPPADDTGNGRPVLGIAPSGKN